MLMDVFKATDHPLRNARPGPIRNAHVVLRFGSALTYLGATFSRSRGSSPMRGRSAIVHWTPTQVSTSMCAITMLKCSWIRGAITRSRCGRSWTNV